MTPSPSPSPTNPAYAITEYSVPAAEQSFGIVAGPDGNLWFTITTGHIGKITTSGVATIYDVPPPTEYGFTNPWGIVEGPDGNLWFTAGTIIGKITTNGIITEYPLPTGSYAQGQIITGLDRNLWFADLSGTIDKMTTSGAITQYPGPAASTAPYGIARGPDGRVWVGGSGYNGSRGTIGAMTTSGAMVHYPEPSSFFYFHPYSLAVGRDKNIWFANQATSITRVTTRGVFTDFPTPTFPSFPWDIVAGPDGNLWFTENYVSKIGRITTDGVITEFPVPNNATGNAVLGITRGPDGYIWFTGYGMIGKIHP